MDIERISDEQTGFVRIDRAAKQDDVSHWLLGNGATRIDEMGEFDLKKDAKN